MLLRYFKDITQKNCRRHDILYMNQYSVCTRSHTVNNTALVLGDAGCG